MFIHMSARCNEQSRTPQAPPHLGGWDLIRERGSLRRVLTHRQTSTHRLPIQTLKCSGKDPRPHSVHSYVVLMQKPVFPPSLFLERANSGVRGIWTGHSTFPELGSAARWCREQMYCKQLHIAGSRFTGSCHPLTKLLSDGLVSHQSSSDSCFVSSMVCHHHRWDKTHVEMCHKGA